MSAFTYLKAPVDEAARLFAAQHPNETGPGAYGLAVAISKGASPQRAADQFVFFYSNALDPAGKVYGSGYSVEVMNKGAGDAAGDGYGYLMSAADFKARYQTAAKAADPNFKPVDCGEGWQWNAEKNACEPIPGFWNIVGSLLSR